MTINLPPLNSVANGAVFTFAIIPGGVGASIVLNVDDPVGERIVDETGQYTTYQTMSVGGSITLIANNNVGDFWVVLSRLGTWT